MAQTQVLQKDAPGPGTQKEMLIRQATQADLPAIVEVLKASLGESKLQKSEEIWRYKHIENPFGESLVLVAVEQDQIIGVRAFMRWQWQFKNKKYSAFRAVDTATHPEHQGKGVFKKLTLRAIEIGKKNGDHFIFNTPNNQSMPGYLKMGWEKVSKLGVRLVPTSPLSWKSEKEKLAYVVFKECSDDHIKSLCDKHNVVTSKKNVLFTPKSQTYLSWRYENNPLQDYEVMAGKGYYLAAYVKDHGKFREFRVVEHLYEGPKALRELRRNIQALASQHGVQVISMGNMGRSTSIFRASGYFGPVLTFRNLELEPGEEKRYLNLNNWSYSLGDLELF